MKTYTEAEVEYLLLKQRELTVLALELGICLSVPNVYFETIEDLVLNSPIVNFEENLKHYDNN